MIEIRWHGRGGQGAFSASKILGAAAVANGAYALAFPSFGPERRGAPIQAFTKIASEKISDRSNIKACDAMIFLDETLYSEAVKRELKPGGKIYLNTVETEKYRQDQQVVAVNADEVAERILHRKVSNTAMLAVFAKDTGIVEKEQIEAMLSVYFPKKVAQKNCEMVEELMREDGERV